MIKRSTFKADKLYLEAIEKIYRDKLQEEAVNNTSRVQGFPKQITVYMFSKKASLVKGICHSLFVNTRTQLNLNKIVISKQS